MILTPLNIQIAIIKAFYALAIKSIKYYAGLSFGKNNLCLFKEIRLLRAYVEILKNFEIVGSTITCSCCVEGTYNVLLNSALPVTNVPIEFGCDNKGYIIYNNVGYDFIYWYDESNKKIVIDFAGALNDVLITVTDVQFTDACDIQGVAVSPIEVATIDEITGPPVKVDNQYGTWDGNINVYEPNGNFELNPPVGIIIPAADIDNVEAILELWNTTYPTWVLQYFEGQYVLYTPFDNVNYTNYIVKFKQYEGGEDSFVSYYLASDSPIGLIPFVTVNTPAYADILFEQNTFSASNVSQTLLVLPPAPLPYVDTPTLAKVDISIPLNQFALGQAATMTIPLYELFNSSKQDFYYNDEAMFSHTGTYANITELVNDFNDNNGQGFTATDGGTIPIPGEVLATAANLPTIFNSSVFGDVYTVKLINTPLSIDTTIGTYEVGDDSPVEIANFIAGNIIAQDIFEGTVGISGTVITLTAPLGTGDSWNFNAGVSTYAFSIQKTGSRPFIYYFNGGVSPPTTPIYLLDIVAPNVFPQTDYNTGIIEIQYPDYEPDGSQFAGAVDDTAGVVTYDDDLNGNIYTSAQNFTNVQSMLNNASLLSDPTATGTITGISGNNNAVTIELAYPPAYVYNGTTFVYQFDPDGPGRVYTSSGQYYGGNDSTESTYDLVILDGNDVPFINSPITNTGNFQSYQAIVDDLNSQVGFNTYFIASLSGIDITITSVYSIQGSTFNDYTFQLALGYDSIQYSPTYNFVTNIGQMSGGVDAVSPNINLYNVLTGIYIYTLLENDYDYDGIVDFVNQFNIDSPSGYSSEYLGTAEDLPEIRSESILNVPVTGAIPNTIMRVFYTSGPSINDPRTYIGTFVPIGLSNFAPNVIAAGLVASMNGNANWGSVDGLATSSGSSILLKAPLNTFGLFNGRKAVLEKTVPNARASVAVIVTTGSTGAATLQLTVSVGSVNLGVQSIPVAATPIDWATAYKNRINSGTTTHGYTSVSIGSSILIFAPVNTGSILNGATISAVATGGVAIQTTPTPTFSNGTDTVTNVDIKTFNLGGYTQYDQVRFTANPAVYTWIYNGNDLIYNDVTNSYSDPGTFTGGNDNTAGQLFLELNGPTTSEILYQDPAAFNYASFQQFTTPINASSTNLGFSATSTNTNLIINSPLNSFAYFNIGYDLHLTYTYASPQWVGDNYSYYNNINNGVDPILTPYEGIFASGVLGDFINTDPCTPTVVTQTCLTNAQVNKIITHITKLIK